MTTNFNKAVLEKMLTLIPANIKPVNFLMDMLDLGKESAYRRLRGDKEFSFDEVSKLSSILGFSLDEIVQQGNLNTAIFNYFDDPIPNPENGILKFLIHYDTYLDGLIIAKSAQLMITMNHLYYSLLLRYETLFRFAYYRWMHQMKQVPLNYSFANLVVDPQITEIRKRIVGKEHMLNNVSYIIDKNLFLNLIKEIQYFFRRGLVNQDEIEVLKKDFYTFMAEIERVLNSGVDRNGINNEIYLSMLNVTSNTIHSIADGREESSFWITLGNPIRTNSLEITTRHKHWIESLKKYTTVISRSNELVQADFINQQREYIDRMTDKIWL